jgi:5-methylcytosine-specific restriction enzyme subunit McrC
VTYCARLDLSTGHLIYAAGDPRPEPYEIVGTGVRLVVHAIDIGRSMEDVESQVDRLAERLLAPTTSAAST